MTGLDRTVYGWRLPTIQGGPLAIAMAEVGAPLLDAVAGADRVVLVPDAHYPYHPSTGMVTKPRVVAALVSELASHRPDASVTVALRSRPGIETTRTATYLGYDAMDATQDLAVTSLDEAPTRRIDAAGASRAVPTPLLDGAVVPVPSARVGGSAPVVGSLAVLTAAAGLDPGDDRAVRAVHDAVSPAGAFLDATHAFAGDPHRARAVFAGRDVTAVDRVLARLLGVDHATVPGLPAGGDAPAGGHFSVEGVDVAALAAELPGGDLPATDAAHPLVRAAYRVYAGVSGDVLPPQLRSQR
jgi:hypothetical protein